MDARHRLEHVVVGLDGSAASNDALRWAVAHVGDAGRVAAVHVVVPTEELALDAALGDSVRLVRHREAELRDVWIPEATGDDHSGDDDSGDDHCLIEPIVREGHVAEQLLRVAADREADAVVVGHHAQARLGPQLVGHVTATLLHTADLPVVIVPLDWAPEHTMGRPVAVGVGVSRGTRAALRWAMSQPELTRHGLTLAHAHGPRSMFRPDGWLDVLAYHLDPTVLPGWIERDLAELAEQLGEETGTDVEVVVSVQPGRTGPRLVEAGATASLLVMGRGEPPFIRNHALAPYLRHAIAHAPCPVAVIPADVE